MATQVIPLREAAKILGISVRAAESALRHAGIKSGYPLADVQQLAVNRPGRGARTDLKQKESPMSHIEFVKAFRIAATQLGTYEIAGNWARLSKKLAEQDVALTATDAARWANAGFLPDEAEAAIADGAKIAEVEHAGNPQRAGIWRGGRRIA